MNIPDVQVATDVESLSHASVQPVVEREEKVNTSTAVRMSFVVVVGFFFAFCFIAHTDLCGQCQVAVSACNSIA